MVSTTTRYKVATVVGVIAVIGVYVLHAGKFLPIQVYSASDSEINLAIVDGITQADTHASSTPAVIIRAVVVPHHLVASEAIARGIKALVPSAPRVVVLISPDHFGRCPKILCTTKGSYKTFFGDAQISDQAVDEILSHSNLAVASDLLTRTPYL